MNKEDVVSRKMEKDQETEIFKDSEDTETIRNILNGSINEYKKIVDKYQKPVYNHFLRLFHNPVEAEDMTQSVFIRAYEKLDSYKSEYRFFSWLYRIAINMSINRLKTRATFTGLDQVRDQLPAMDDQADEKLTLVESAVNNLKIHYKQVIILKYYQKLSYGDIAYALNISENKVRSRLYDARIQLKNILEKKGFFN